MKKKYIKPLTEVIRSIKTEIILTSSITEQCDCYTFRVYGGCQGCRGKCGCGHWDSEELKWMLGC